MSDYVCPACGRRDSSPGTCCGDEPLLDCNRPEVLELLMDMDQRRHDRRDGWTRGGAVLLGIPLAILLMVLLPPITGLLPLPRFINIVLVMVAVSSGCYVLLTRLLRFRPRFPWAEKLLIQGPSTSPRP